ncbi:hypothetical protein COT68_00940 [bacterium (Candidatus Torokbacteria) CG09_land_8_20_14_0_10_42_11]|nr:MAG: hypothetical protein COT68_00940 [bacterium (Candidatus Torokbacteria) CG09_land_8_20_14_0_10_42_11]
MIRRILRQFSAYWRVFFRAQFWRNRLNLGLLGSGLFFNLLTWIILARFIKPSEYPIPLHYNIYFGIDLIGPYSRVFSLPLISLFILVMNFILAFWFYPKDRLVAYILLLAAAVTQIFVLIGAVSLIYINR